MRSGWGRLLKRVAGEARPPHTSRPLLAADPSPGLYYICTPNKPTGHRYAAGDISADRAAAGNRPRPSPATSALWAWSDHEHQVPAPGISWPPRAHLHD